MCYRPTMFWFIAAILLICLAAALVHVLVLCLLVLVVIDVYRYFRPARSGQFLDGRELDARDPIDRAIMGGREAQEREDRATEDVRRRAWR